MPTIKFRTRCARCHSRRLIDDLKPINMREYATLTGRWVMGDHYVCKDRERCDLSLELAKEKATMTLNKSV